MQEISIHARKMQGLEQAVFWLFIWLFIFDYYFLEDNWASAIWKTSMEVSTYAVLVYFNLLVSIPLLLKKKRVWIFVISMASMVALYTLVMRWSGLESSFYEHQGWRNVFSMILNTSLFLLISSLYWHFKQLQVERERYFILKSEKLEAELKFLRAQIGPHFIFNSLNNIYTLALQKHDNAAPMVAKLAALLRYVLDEGSQQLSLLKREIETLKEYIELQRMRKSRSNNVDFYTEGSVNGLKIPPMLLLNLVENCFKHSNIEQDEAAYIKISCEISETGLLDFHTENSMRASLHLDEKKGIGLENAQRQLTLEYPGTHRLDMLQEGDVFKLTLQIQLKQS